MKIKPEHYKVFKNGIAKLKAHFKKQEDTIESFIRYGIENSKNYPKNYELRFLFDIFYNTRLFLKCNHLDSFAEWEASVRSFYDYANDFHLESALKKICKELGIDFTKKD